jgi:hypothetical protein
MAGRQGQGGGPNTDTGKQRSSRNSTKHGCTARQVALLENEDPEEYDAHERRWVTEYRDERVSNERLRQEVIRASWLLQRIERRYDEVEAKLGKKSILKWTEAEHQQMQLVLRYRTTAERTFHRALGALEGMRRGRELEKIALEKYALAKEDRARARAAREARERGAEKKEAEKREVEKPKAEEPRFKTPKLKELRQHISVWQDGDEVKTHFWYSNEVTREDMEKYPEATHVLRIIYPCSREIKGYEWLTDVFKEKWPENPMCYQRMTYAKWREVTEREQATLGEGHVGPTSEEEDEDWEG